jgi:hypothetical protein
MKKKIHAILILVSVLLYASLANADVSLVKIVTNKSAQDSLVIEKVINDCLVWLSSPMDEIPTISNDIQNYEMIKNWVINRMLIWAKPGKSFYPMAGETFEEGKLRYESIATSILSTVVKEKPIFPGKTGRIRTAALMLSIAMFESGFRRDVDLNLGTNGRGDGGKSWCMMQVQLGNEVYVGEDGKIIKGLTPPKDEAPWGSHISTPMHVILKDDGGLEFTNNQSRGFSGQDLIRSREICFTVGLRVIRSSFASCRELPLMERLSLYASGNCENGKDASRNRVGAAMAWVNSNPPPVNDERLIELIQKLSSKLNFR